MRILSTIIISSLLALSPSPVFAENPPVIKKTKLELPADLRPFQTLRVLVIKNSKEITVQTSSPYQVFDAGGSLLFSGQEMPPTVVRNIGSNIKIGSRTFANVPVTIQLKQGTLRAAKKSYRNALTFWPDRVGTVMAVNEVNIEDYLRGVLPWEANPKWPAESLKAQAIASRTYALFQAIDRKLESYDLSGDAFGQVYAGKSIEHSATDQAIDSTRGQVLLFDKKLFPAFFHSTCGGSTARVDWAWRAQPNDALKGVPCEFCKISKHYRWSGALDESHIVQALHKAGINFDTVNQISTVNPDAGGRAQYFLIHSGGQSVKVLATDFRLWVGPDKLKSTKIESIRREGNQYVFQGYGWGHGVGMCQYGMKNLGDLGYTYKQILSYYYPESYIAQT